MPDYYGHDLTYPNVPWGDLRTYTEGHAVKLLRNPAAVAVTALALAALPSAALAHDGSHPFENCTAAYEAGHAGIAKGDKHYGAHLDRDKDGVGCDKPPKDFVPAGDDDADDQAGDPGPDDATGQKDTALAETGGDGTTGYVAGGGTAVLLAGAGVLVALRRRRAER